MHANARLTPLGRFTLCLVRFSKTLRSSSSHSRVTKRLSARALSKQSPTDPVERVIRAALQALAKS